MKQLIHSVLVTVVCLTLVGCCAKVACRGPDQIEFYNFIQFDLDELIILSYEKGTSLATPIDSVKTMARNQIGYNYFSAYPFSTIDGSLDYKIKITNTGQVFVVNHFETVKATCNECFPFGHDTYDVISNYLVNGRPQSGSVIRIYK